MQAAFGCVIGTPLVPALANPALLPVALATASVAGALWGGGGALIAGLGRMDLATALRTSAARGRVRARRPLVVGLQLVRGLGVLLVAAWLTQ